MGPPISQAELQTMTDPQFLDAYVSKTIEASAEPYVKERMEIIKKNGELRIPPELKHNGKTWVDATLDEPGPGAIFTNN